MTATSAVALTVSNPQATSAATAPDSGATGSVSGSGTGGALDTDFTMFLKLLTTQLRNQDPLNPMDSSDFAVQLATFSGVEQQTKTNALLQTIGGQLGQSSMSQLSGWMGMEARAVAPTAYSGAPISLSPTVRSGADQAVLVVKDASGTQVDAEPVPVGATSFSWGGTDAAGNPVAKGTYSFSLQSYQNGKLLGSDDVPSYSRVVEAQAGSGGTVLVLEGGATVNAADVTALRAAP